MQPENAIEVRDVTKKFKVFLDKGNQLKERLLFQKRNRYENRWVLNGISFNVRKGEAIGLIGHNGCGKSTTLKLLTKIIYPDSGTIEMRGRVSSLIELGAGFHPDMSGRENIYINAAIFGLSKKEIDARLEDIIAFSELEEYIDNPVRTYSSGMYMRLAFSVAINVNADILLIDEILAVGDAHFQEKCFDKLHEIKENGTTIVIVSHSMGQIEEICDRCIWIDSGKIRMEGNPVEVDEKYLEYMGVRKKDEKEKEKELVEKRKEEQREKQLAAEEKLMSGTFHIKNIQYVSANGEAQKIFFDQENEKITINYSVDSICDEATLSFTNEKNGRIKCEGTDLKSLPMQSFQTEMKLAQLLPYLSDIGRSHENYVSKMRFNKQCELQENGMLIHPDGLIYGPYITVPAMQYKLVVDVKYDGYDKPILTVTKESGNVRIGEFPLDRGYNSMQLYLEERAENLEFVLTNNIGTDIKIKTIQLI